MPKQIMGSVGYGGRNAPNDVATVQYLLDCVPTSHGGPLPELVIDGLFGPRTGGAIRDFQRASGNPQDGRVDPGGPTFRTLASYDPFPNQSLPPMEQSGSGAMGKAANTTGGNERYDFISKSGRGGGGVDWGSASGSSDGGWGSAGASSGGWGSAGKSSGGNPPGKSGPGGNSSWGGGPRGKSSI